MSACDPVEEFFADKIVVLTIDLTTRLHRSIDTISSPVFSTSLSVACLFLDIYVDHVLAYQID